MKRSTETKFTALSLKELKNTFGGKKTYEFYKEDGIIKVRLVEIKD